MTPTSTMTLSEFLEKDPTLYDNAISYVWNSETGQWQTAPIREETKELLFEEFCDRYVNNDQKFKRLYVKKLNSLALRYAELRRNDMTAFDPLVADYMERKEVSQANASHTSESEDNSSKIGQSSGTSQSTKTGVEGIDKVNVSDPQVIQYKKEKRTPNLTETTQTTGEESETKNEHADDKGVDKAAPMSISYPGAAAGKAHPPDNTLRSGIRLYHERTAEGADRPARGVPGRGRQHLLQQHINGQNTKVKEAHRITRTNHRQELVEEQRRTRVANGAQASTQLQTTQTETGMRVTMWKIAGTAPRH